eukprot:s1308_g16.t1
MSLCQICSSWHVQSLRLAANVFTEASRNEERAFIAWLSQATSSIKPECQGNPHNCPFRKQMRRQASARPHRSRLTAGLEKGAKCGRFASHQHANALAAAFRRAWLSGSCHASRQLD